MATEASGESASNSAKPDRRRSGGIPATDSFRVTPRRGSTRPTAVLA